MDILKTFSEAQKGNTRALAKLLSTLEKGNEELSSLLARSSQKGSARVIGITGPGGVGKSSLLNELLPYFTQQGKVALLAIDPSSRFTGGAFLGDRLRMPKAGRHPQIFIRSMANRGHPGGLSPLTEEAIQLLKLSGYTTIFVETLGVGQGEMDIFHTVDTVVVVFAPGVGDAIQLSKAGIMEIGDIYIVQKSDLEEATYLAEDLEFLLSHRKNRPPLLLVSAKERKGVKELYEELLRHCSKEKSSVLKIHQKLERQLLQNFLSYLHSPKVQQEIQRLASDVVQQKLSLQEALQKIANKGWGCETRQTTPSS